MVAQCNHVFQANVVAFYVVPIIIIIIVNNNNEIAVMMNRMLAVIFSHKKSLKKRPLSINGRIVKVFS